MINRIFLMFSLFCLLVLPTAGAAQSGVADIPVVPGPGQGDYLVYFPIKLSSPDPSLAFKISAPKGTTIKVLTAQGRNNDQALSVLNRAGLIVPMYFGAIASRSEVKINNTDSFDIPGNGVIEGASFLYFDKCNPLKARAAGVQITLPPDEIKEGNFVRAEINIFNYVGRRQMSHKAVSDGKYGPKPLNLAAPVYPYAFFQNGDGAMEVVTIKGRKLNRTNVPIADFVGYGPAGGALWRGVLTAKHLTGGGCGIWTARAGPYGYSHAGPRRRIDWFAGGYPVVAR
jgi:hypothetical protein